MRLILIRHGDAYAGFNGVIAGPRGCAGLTPLGRRQAEALCRSGLATGRLKADALITSLLPRAIETSEIVAPAVGQTDINQDCDLCEVHTGEADGLGWSEYERRYGPFDMEALPDREFAPGGDSWHSFHLRVHRVLHRIASDYPDQTVVVVCHAGVIAASLRLLLGGGDHPGGAQVRPSNTGVTEWQYEPERDQWLLHSFNERGHLIGIG